MSGADLLLSHLELVWGQRNTELAREMYHEAIVDHMPFPGQVPGPEGMIAVLDAVHAAIPDLSVEVHEVLDLGDGRALDRWTMRGTHEGPLLGMPGTGKHVEFHGIDIARFEDGKMVEIWHVEELLQLLMQAGLKVSGE